MPTSDTTRRGSALSTCHRGQLLVNYYTKKCDMLLNDNELKTTIYRIKLNGATRHKSREAQFVISRLQVRFLLPAPTRRKQTHLRRVFLWKRQEKTGKKRPRNGSSFRGRFSELNWFRRPWATVRIPRTGSVHPANSVYGQTAGGRWRF